MRGKGIILAVCVSVLLTGCGDDAVLRQAKSENVDFVSSIYEVKEDREIEKPEIAVQQDNTKLIQQLIEVNQRVIKKFKEQEDGKAAKESENDKKSDTNEKSESNENSEEADGTDIDWNDPESILQRYQNGSFFSTAYDIGDNPEDYIEEESEEEVDSIDSEGNISVDEMLSDNPNAVGGYIHLYYGRYRENLTREQLRELLAELEKIGCTNLVSPFEEFADAQEKAVEKTVEKTGGISYLTEDEQENAIFTVQDGISFVRCGIQFALDGLRNKKNENFYNLTIQIPTAMIVAPQQYKDFLQTNVTDGFYIGCINVGGYLDCFNLVSGWNEWNSPYNKCVDCYLKDQQLIEMEILLEKNTNYKGENRDSAVLFTLNEQQTLTRLVGGLCGDETAAKEFVENFTLKKGHRGTVGSCKWSVKKLGDVLSLVIEA